MAEVKYYRFTDRDEFLRVSGWKDLGDRELMLPAGIAVDEVGPVVAAPTVGPNNRPVAGKVIDPNWHVNVLTDGSVDLSSLASYEVVPQEPVRTFAIEPKAESAKIAPPETVLAWQGKVVLRRHNLLASVEQAIALVGGEAEIIWNNASSWGRQSILMDAMSKQMGISDESIDAMFIEASELRG